MPTDLAARLEAATEGSRELSDAVLEAAGWERYTDGGFLCWHDQRGRVCLDGSQPDPTADLNAAYALIPPEWIGFDLCASNRHERLSCELYKDGEEDISAVGNGYTPALALSAALCRAMEK